MYSFFDGRMENYQGDLADIVRASGGGGGSVNGLAADWQFPSESMTLPLELEEPTNDFGDPFSNLRDPLLHELDISGSGVFNNSKSSDLMKMNIEDGSSETGSVLAQKVLDEELQRPCNFFSRMLQISPNPKTPLSPRDTSMVVAPPRGISTSSLISNDMVKANSSAGSSIDNSGLQISSPRNTGVKRRKSQAKKVVCIPAPAAANSRPTGEVVPSDLWAWRKYGQKPIKGSPYPRGYYRCSSSKGCSARKQVERSRTDPNMLVITYTSEHNHPWPTQRNALAGSTRSQPTKNSATSKNSSSSQAQKATSLKEEHKERNNDSASPVIAGSSTSCTIKEEIGDTEKPIDMEESEFNHGITQSYRPVLPDSNQSDDFFADLAELEAEPLNLLFSQGFTGEKCDEERNIKALDPFSLYDWTGNTTFEESKRGL